MRRSTSLVCIRAAAFSLPVIAIACGSGTTSPGFGDDTSSNSNSTRSTSTSASVGTTVVYTTSTSVSTSHLADGGVTSTTVTVTQSSTVTTTQSNSSTSATTSSDAGAVASDAGDAGVRTCPVAGTSVLADFEDGKAAMVASNGYTGVFNAQASAGTKTDVVALSDDPMPSSCNTRALHATIGGPIATGGYGQVRGDFLAHVGMNTFPPPDSISGSGISFDIKAGTGTNSGPITFEVLSQETLPATDPSTGTAQGGTAATAGVDEYNNRGWILAAPTSTWTTVFVPFSILIPHWLPSPGASGCGSSGPCQAPMFNPAHALGLQFAVNPDQNPNGAFDIWVDNIQLFTGTNGLVPPAMPNGIAPTFKDGALAGCTKPTGNNVGGKYLQWAYKNWYSRFVVSAGSGQLRVQRPENNNDTVSEGIGYGMLIAVYFGDKTLFDGLWSYWKANGTGAGTLMTWQVPNQGSSGSATDADQDAAFALLEADKVWPGNGYNAGGVAMLKDIWTHDIDPTSSLPRGGSNFTGTTGSGILNLTNPSYFAPEYYTVFGQADTTHTWSNVKSAVYTALASITNGGKLPPAWCGSNCANAQEYTAATDVLYQYDAHRVPWRVGLDKCWNNSSQATAIINTIVGKFSTIASTGVGRLVDIYNLDGSANSTAPNSTSLIGSAAVGGMGGSYSAFVNEAWQFVLDGENRALLDVAQNGSQSGYSYYNATVGLITLLSMSGNLYPM